MPGLCPRRASCAAIHTGSTATTTTPYLTAAGGSHDTAGQTTCTGTTRNGWVTVAPAAVARGAAGAAVAGGGAGAAMAGG